MRVCVREIEEDRQISVADRYKRAGRSPLYESPPRSQSLFFGGVMRLHFHFVWENSRILRLSVCM